MRKRCMHALPLAALLLGAACVKQPVSGVGLQNAQTRVAFGANTPAPSSTVPTPAPLTAAEREQLGPSFNDKAYLSRLPPVSSNERCVKAAPGSAAAEAAGLNAKGTPATGVYRWKYAGTRSITTPPVKFNVSGFERRLLRNVRRTGNDFTFEVAEPDKLYNNRVVVTTYRVRPAARNQQVTATDQRAGDPDRGLSILRVDSLDAKTGQSVSSFQPQPPILLLPLPVLAGERFQSIGADPRTLRSVEIDAQVVRRERVDACGEIVDGWYVKATRTDSGSTPVPYDLIVATQLGAMPISLHTIYQNPAVSADVTFSLGQVKPSRS